MSTPPPPLGVRWGEGVESQRQSARSLSVGMGGPESTDPNLFSRTAPVPATIEGWSIRASSPRQQRRPPPPRLFQSGDPVWARGRNRPPAFGPRPAFGQFSTSTTRPVSDQHLTSIRPDLTSIYPGFDQCMPSVCPGFDQSTCDPFEPAQPAGPRPRARGARSMVPVGRARRFRALTPARGSPVGSRCEGAVHWASAKPV